jgi:hypothetical protein
MPVYNIGITDINTQVRRLGYASAILLILGTKTLSESLLHDRLQKWSAQHENELKSYINPQGQINPTRGKSGVKYYTEFVLSLGLIGRIAGACRITRFGKVLLHFLSSQRKDNAFVLGSIERYKYLYWLVVKDSDRLLTVMNMLAEQPNQPLSQLQNNFQDSYIKFLDHRINTEDERTAREILSLRNSVTHDWKNPRKYAESIVPPRLNWLLDLGLANISTRGTTLASLTDSGRDLMKALPTLPNSDLRYVTQLWLRNNYFSSTGPAISGQKGQRWQDISKREQRERLLILTSEAFNALRTSPVPKVSLLPVLLFVTLSLAADDLWLEIDELKGELEHQANQAGIPFEVRFSHRENESYLISRPA